MGKITQPENSAKEIITRLFKDEGIEYFSGIKPETAIISMPRLMPSGTKSIVLFLMPYYVEDLCENRNIARFAVSRDYHLYGKMLEEKLVKEFQKAQIDRFVKVMCDHSPLDEKQCATKLGLGTFGKNRVIINEKYGSYVFIGAVFTDVCLGEIQGRAQNDGQICTCNNCGKCVKSCPTFLSENGECISALTQKKALTDVELDLISRQKCVWGCDICQEVCPANFGIVQTPIKFFHQNRLPHVTSEVIDQMSPQDFSMRSYGWRKKETILRNLENSKIGKQ